MILVNVTFRDELQVALFYKVFGAWCVGKVISFINNSGGGLREAWGLPMHMRAWFLKPIRVEFSSACLRDDGFPNSSMNFYGSSASGFGVNCVLQFVFFLFIFPFPSGGENGMEQESIYLGRSERRVKAPVWVRCSA